MKFLLPFSLFTNLLLAGFAGYLLGTRAPVSSIEGRPPSIAGASVDGSIPKSADPRTTSSVGTAAAVATSTSPEALPAVPLVRGDELIAGASTSGVVALASSPSALSFVPAGSDRSLRGSAASSSPATEYAGGINEGAGAVSGELVRAQNPAGLGNSVAFQGIRVGLTETYDSADAAERGLGVELSADVNALAVNDSNSSDTAGDVVAVAQHRSDDANETQTLVSGRPGSVGKPPRTARSVDGSEPDGLSYEDELFRMKWGWAAFDAARSEAKREADRLRHGG